MHGGRLKTKWPPIGSTGRRQIAVNWAYTSIGTLLLTSRSWRSATRHRGSICRRDSKLSSLCLAMPEPLAYLNGQLIAAQSSDDPGLRCRLCAWGYRDRAVPNFPAASCSACRTTWPAGASLAIAGIRLDVKLDELAEIAQRLASHNYGLVDPADDLGLCIFATPGSYTAMAEGVVGGPNGLHAHVSLAVSTLGRGVSKRRAR